METKSNPNPVRVARVHGSVLGQAQAQRKAIEAIVGEHVEPLVAVQPRVGRQAGEPTQGGEEVVPARMLLSYVDRQPERLSAEEVERAQASLARALEDLSRARERTDPPRRRRRPTVGRPAPR